MSRILPVAAIVALAWLRGCSPEPAPRPPNVILILADDPEEQSNLASVHPELVSELAILLAGEIKRGRSTPGRPLPVTGTATWEQVSWLKELEKSQ